MSKKLAINKKELVPISIPENIKSMAIVMRDPGGLKPWDGNARVHDEKQFTALTASMRKYGFQGTVVINEALEIARRFSTFEATQFINGILDAIKLDLEKAGKEEPKADGKSTAS